MKSVQLDECMDDKRFARACNSEGIVRAKRFPKRLRNRAVSDEEALRQLLPRCDLFVTKDLRIADQNAHWLPGDHAGILIITLGPDATRTMTTHIARDLLRKLKDSFADWSEPTWNSSIMELSPDYIEVNHVVSGSLVRDATIDRNTANWQEELQSILHQNAERTGSMTD